MTTANYQLLSLYMTLCLICTSLGMVPITYDMVIKNKDSGIEEYSFQNKAIALAGGVIQYQKTSLTYESKDGQFPRAEFANIGTGNTGFLTRYFSKDQAESTNWDTRIQNAEKFKAFNEDGQGNLRNDMISNGVFKYGMLLYTTIDNGFHSNYIFSMYETGGFQVMFNMIFSDEAFVEFLGCPFKRFQFYIDLVRIWTVLVQEMKMKICIGALETITVRVPDERNPTYRPIFRHPEWAVGLTQPCEDFSANYSSKSVLAGKIEDDEAEQKTVEMFTLGRLIYVIEIIMAHQTYESKNEETTILDECETRELQIKEDRTADEETYSNTSLFEAVAYYRATIKAYREGQPIEDGDTNAAVESAYESMFDLLDKMIRENDVSDGRPSWEEVGAGFNQMLESVAPFYQERRLLLI